MVAAQIFNLPAVRNLPDHTNTDANTDTNTGHNPPLTSSVCQDPSSHPDAVRSSPAKVFSCFSHLDNIVQVLVLVGNIH